MKFIFLVALSCIPFLSFCQFPGPAGTSNSTAISHNDPLIVAWGDSVLVQRGVEDISVLNSPEVTYGQPEYALGEVNSNVVSLGDGGSATYYFSSPIKNELGFDFAVFENGFSDQFLELAFVEVSSDGVNFSRFPAQCFIQDTIQIATFEASGDATKIHNLAGKYRVNFGTPFELDELIDEPNVDINQIHYIRIIDVVGSIDPIYGSQDVNGNFINDPYPTAFASGGFDLDAIAVFHMEGAELKENEEVFDILPPLVQSGTELVFNDETSIEFVLYDEMGRILNVFENKFIVPENSGNYFVRVIHSNGIQVERVVVY